MTLIEDVRNLKDSVRELRELVDKDHNVTARHEEQISGERGISNAVNLLAGEIKSLRKAAYWVAGLIMAGSVGFAFSVLQLIH